MLDFSLFQLADALDEGLSRISTARLISTSMASLMVARSGAAAAAAAAAAVFAWRAGRTLSWLSCSVRSSFPDLLSSPSWLSRWPTR